MPNKSNVWTAMKPVSDNVEEGGEKAVEGECALLFIAEATTPEVRATCPWNVCGSISVGYIMNMQASTKLALHPSIFLNFSSSSATAKIAASFAPSTLCP